MGYSARYHATSLVAVFLALAIGILIGAEFGGDTLTNTRKDLEHSLTGNLQDARDAGRRPERANWLAPTNSPAASIRRWSATGSAGRRIGVVALGDLPGDVPAIEEALGPTGARLVGIGVVREPVDLRRALPTTSRRPASPTSGPTPTR